MTRDEALEFLRAHQPMPADETLDRETIDAYDEARKLFRADPDPECVPLFLNSFGEGSGFGIYQVVDEVIAKHPPSTVVPALLDSLTSPHPSVRHWSARIAVEFQDARLLEPLAALLADDLEDIRVAAVDALSQLGAPEAISAVRRHAEVETSPEVLEAIEDALSL